MREIPTKIVINPEYKRFEDFVRQVPAIFSTEGRVIYKIRNEIRVFVVDGVELNVKRYKVPIFINRFIYRFFRQSKAQRAYEYALQLLSRKIETASPVAYILYQKNGLLGDSYFVSLQSSGETLYQVGKDPVGLNEDVFRALGTYVANLHENGVYHADLSPGNILFERKKDHVEFCLLDINRMSFAPVSLKKGCANFARLWGNETAFHLMAETYAATRGFDKKECLRWILYYRNRFWKKYAKKRKIEFEL